MCGLTGFVDLNGRLTDPDQHLRRMTDTLRHRGPDDEGLWLDRDAGVGLGHRRLAILDLSSEGHQPMVSSSGRYVIVYNGEVYNFGELRQQLQKIDQINFRGHSDTEVMLAAIEEWGLERAVSRFLGMFAFAIWDRQERVLRLVRDRVGIKPLYYGTMGGAFLFGSELKSLRAHPKFRTDIDRGALALFTRFSYVPAPYTIYRGIRKLPPGCILTLSLSEATRGAALPEPRMQTYWSARRVAEEGQSAPVNCTREEAVERLDGLLRDAVRARMVADVPLGAFLSGGIDSSTVVALMQAQSTIPVKTFSIGFQDDAYNEAANAKSVAAHLGTEHTELYVSPQQAMDVLPQLPTLYDEPFSDSSQIPTFLVSQLARQHVTVSLSGDGGDELFCGYNRYLWGRRVWNNIGWIPKPLRAGGAAALNGLSPATWDRLLKPLMPLVPKRYRATRVGDNVHKLASVLDVQDPDELYLRLVSHCRDPLSAVVCETEPPTTLTDPAKRARLAHFTERMMFLDLISYLPDDTLTKVDRASMGVGLEARVPLLDHRVVEFAWSLPTAHKLHEGQGKWPLRQVLNRYVPEHLVDRPKMGFGIPIDSWLRGPLRDWCENLLDQTRLQQEGLFYPLWVRRLWAEHLSGQQNRAYDLWDVLMFQAWLETQQDAGTNPGDRAAKAALK